jgi:hypothetical protein
MDMLGTLPFNYERVGHSGSMFVPDGAHCTKDHIGLCTIPHCSLTIFYSNSTFIADFMDNH